MIFIIIKFFGKFLYANILSAQQKDTCICVHILNFIQWPTHRAVCTSMNFKESCWIISECIRGSHSEWERLAEFVPAYSTVCFLEWTVCTSHAWIARIQLIWHHSISTVCHSNWETFTVYIINTAGFLYANNVCCNLSLCKERNVVYPASLSKGAQRETNCMLLAWDSQRLL